MLTSAPTKNTVASDLLSGHCTHPTAEISQEGAAVHHDQVLALLGSQDRKLLDDGLECEGVAVHVWVECRLQMQGLSPHTVCDAIFILQ